MKSSLSRVSELMLDAMGCAAEGRRIDPYPDLAPCTDGDAVVWFTDHRASAAESALINGTIAHHAELDDGHPGASLHGGVTIIPAALAVAETIGSTGSELLAAIEYGYAAAVAYGRPLLAGIERHRLHPPSMVGCLGAAAAAGRLLSCEDEALLLAGTLMPLGPFESFTKGAPVKDLYAGYPAFVGVQSAILAREGIVGPPELFKAERDGVGAFLAHGVHKPAELDLDEVLHVETDARGKFRKLAGDRAPAIETAVDALASASNVRALTRALSGRLRL